MSSLVSLLLLIALALAFCGASYVLRRWHREPNEEPEVQDERHRTRQ